MRLEQLEFGIPETVAAAGDEDRRAELDDLIRRLDARREIVGMSPQALAERAGLSVATVQAVMARERTPQLETIAALAHALGFRLGLQNAA